MPEDGRATRRVAILAHHNVTMIDVAGPADVFSHANTFGAAYETVLVSPDGADAVTSNGLTLRVGAAAAEVAGLDTVIVPGAYGMVEHPFASSLVNSVDHLTAVSSRVASVCTGSFLLAEIGLLNHRKATTHFTRLELFRTRFSAVDVQDDALYVRDGTITTSAGIGSGIDLALTFVEDDYGPELARLVARQMLIFVQRPGGASQFSAASRFSAVENRPLRALVDAIVADPAADYSVAAMAAHAHVSPRQLARLFADELSVTPARYVETVRLEAAQTLLQRGYTVQSAAELSGLGSAPTLRRLFLARLGVSPSVYAERMTGA
ncbi:GlxA family transcriptional regulator [Subtercola lobariae]|uniref:Transcription regulator, AraC family protein n=1 Tax=Subtercola lobariae TaxID=1588641 RepID=A0A917B9J4_9MICO|nr:DJ-1/PfpI family protein [Subtercola lobariae]GGF31560.1 putative transcription regulator, AraC family protein [Subtercola lobariae]